MGLFDDVYVILDCTELFVENPSQLGVRKQLFSNYKHHATFKFLIGVGPQMGITYVSQMYGGRASDKYITGHSSDLLSALQENGGAVMADRGFVVQAEMTQIGVKLYTPVFLGRHRPQLTGEEVDKSEKLSRVRCHVERAIQRIKSYHILDGDIRLSMKDSFQEIFTACAYLVNFQTPIVQK